MFFLLKREIFTMYSQKKKYTILNVPLCFQVNDAY